MHCPDFSEMPREIRTEELLSESDIFALRSGPKIVLPVILPPGGQACNKSSAHRVANRNHNNRYCCRRQLRSAGGGRTKRDKDINRQTGKFCCCLQEPIWLALRCSILNDNILTLDIAKTAQSLPEVIPHRRIVDDANARDFVGWRGACAASGQALATAPPRSVTNSRRFIASPEAEDKAS